MLFPYATIDKVGLMKEHNVYKDSRLVLGSPSIVTGRLNISLASQSHSKTNFSLVFPGEWAEEHTILPV
jgi:hypothetical protein